MKKQLHLAWGADIERKGWPFCLAEFVLSLCLVFAELIVISARDEDEETFSQQITKVQEFLYIKPSLLRNYSEAEENFLFSIRAP